jgi:hypothetical protein
MLVACRSFLPGSDEAGSREVGSRGGGGMSDVLGVPSAAWFATPLRIRTCRLEEARTLLGTESYLNLPFLLRLAASRHASASESNPGYLAD